jgi:alpha-beta hydrolase superfamily lysophospholipase
MRARTACARLIVAVSCLALAVAHASGQASATRDVRQLGQAFVDLLARGQFVEAARSFDETMTRLVPPAKLEQFWGSLAGSSGAFRERGGARRDRLGAYERAFVTCRFERADLDLLVVFDRAGRITGLFVQPGYAVPAYADVRLFHQREVSIGDLPSALPGTLTSPADCSRCPAVVLVHGSGPNDRDESLGTNKPFRDLALGLASRGIAVLQYDKRSYAHPGEVAALKTITVKQEVIDDAVAAVTLLRKTRGVAADRVFLLGHSLGAALAPRIAREDSAIAGLILLAGPTRPLEDSFVEQQQYLASLNGQPSEQQKAQIDSVRAQAERVKTLKDSDELSNEMLLHAPPSYWLDLRRNPATEIAKGLKQPMLVLQGERDYQVTMADFMGWREALASKRNVTFKSYPALSHLFLEGTGKSKPAEYQQIGHVPEVVIDDIAAWIKRQ